MIWEKWDTEYTFFSQFEDMHTQLKIDFKVYIIFCQHSQFERQGNKQIWFEHHFED